MAKKILIGLFFLIAIPALLFFFTHKPKEANPAQTITNQATPTQKPLNAQTTLAFSPSSYTLSSSSGSLDLIIDTNQNNVTAAQLEILYDPKVISNVAIIPGSFFESPIDLLKKIDPQTGKISYAFGAGLAAKPSQGKGTLATITFTTSLQKGQTATVTILPETIVTAEGEEASVLKQTTNAVITY